MVKLISYQFQYCCVVWGVTYKTLITCLTGVVVGVLRRGLRSVWDAFVFHAVIKKRGLIPSRDGFTVRRIAGPGLASSYFFQVSCRRVCLAW